MRCRYVWVTTLGYVNCTYKEEDHPDHHRNGESIVAVATEHHIPHYWARDKDYAE